MTTSAPSVAIEPTKNLAMVALFLAPSIRRAIQAEYIIRAAELYYFAQTEPSRAFRTNPANTLMYQSLGALVERSVVHVSETLTELPRELRIRVPIRRKGEVVQHRHALSHPTRVKWDGGMQEFFEEDRQWTDDRAAILWDLQKSINEELRKCGQKTFNEDVPVTDEMASTLFLILVYAIGEGFEVPAPNHLLRWLEDARANFVKNLESRPDGRRTSAPRTRSRGKPRT